jgi:hypothetical protein
MQYDLFCKSNRVGRTILSIASILTGIANSEAWWGLLAIAYGCYLMTSTYSAANHTAHKLAKQIREAGMNFPASRYEFTEDGMYIISLPDEKSPGDSLAYSDFYQLGEDREYFYIFRDQYGGYMVPKSELDEKQEDFRVFIQQKTGQRFRSRMAPVVKLIRLIQDRREESYHL